MLKINQCGFYKSRDFFEVYPTPLRITTEYELEVYAPSDSILMLNGEKYTHAGHAVFFFPPGSERFSIGAFSCANIHFSTDDSDLISYLSTLPPCIPIEPDSDFSERCLAVAACDRQTAEGRLKQSSLLVSLLLSIGQRAHQIALPITPPHKYTQNLMNAKKYMDENYSERITLETLSKITFLSKNFFRSLFSDYFGLSPSDYLAKVRVGHAIELFRTTDLPFSEIALSCGFGSQSYMNAVVKYKTNRTPLDYRKEADGRL